MANETTATPKTDPFGLRTAVTPAAPTPPVVPSANDPFGLYSPRPTGAQSPQLAPSTPRASKTDPFGLLQAPQPSTAGAEVTGAPAAEAEGGNPSDWDPLGNLLGTTPSKARAPKTFMEAFDWMNTPAVGAEDINDHLFGGSNSGWGKGVSDVLAGLSSPLSVALLTGGPIAGALGYGVESAPGIVKGLKYLMDAGFTVQQGYGAVKSMPALADAWASAEHLEAAGDLEGAQRERERAKEIAVNGLAGAGFAALGGFSAHKTGAGWDWADEKLEKIGFKVKPSAEVQLARELHKDYKIDSTEANRIATLFDEDTRKAFKAAAKDPQKLAGVKEMIDAGLDPRTIAERFNEELDSMGRGEEKVPLPEAQKPVPGVTKFTQQVSPEQFLKAVQGPKSKLNMEAVEEIRKQIQENVKEGKPATEGMRPLKVRFGRNHEILSVEGRERAEALRQEGIEQAPLEKERRLEPEEIAERQAYFQELSSRQIMKQKYTPKEAESVIAAYKLALNPTPQMTALAKAVRAKFLDVGTRGSQAGVLHALIDDYTTNMYQQEKENEPTNTLQHLADNGEFHTNVSMAMHRMFENAHEARMHGYKLAVTDPIALAAHQEARVGEAIAARKFIARINDKLVRASDGMPMVALDTRGQEVKNAEGEITALQVNPFSLRDPRISDHAIDVLRKAGVLEQYIKAGKVIQIGGTRPKGSEPPRVFPSAGGARESEVLSSESEVKKQTEIGNADLLKAASDFAEAHGGQPMAEVTSAPGVDPRAYEIAKRYEHTASNPDDPEVKEAYNRFRSEVKGLWGWARSRGYTFERWMGKGEPYKSAKDMMKDVQENKHLYYFTGGALGDGHPMAASDAETGETFNNMFRAVEDLYGHAMRGHNFGSRGKEAAYQTLSELFSPVARKALFTETKAQDSWKDFGDHLRDKDGNPIKEGQPGFLPPNKRPLAEQKAVVLPEELRRPRVNANQLIDMMGDSKRQWALLQADNPHGRAPEGGAQENARRTEALKTELQRLGFHPYAIEGHPANPSGELGHSFFVPDIDRAAATGLMQKYEQASLLHSGGLLDIATGVVTPITGPPIRGAEAVGVYGAVKKTPYYSVIKTEKGDVPFHVPVGGDQTSPAKPGVLANLSKEIQDNVKAARTRLAAKPRPTLDDLIKGEEGGLDPQHLADVLWDWVGKFYELGQDFTKWAAAVRSEYGQDTTDESINHLRGVVQDQIIHNLQGQLAGAGLLGNSMEELTNPNITAEALKRLKQTADTGMARKIQEMSEKPAPSISPTERPVDRNGLLLPDGRFVPSPFSHGVAARDAGYANLDSAMNEGAVRVTEAKRNLRQEMSFAAKHASPKTIETIENALFRSDPADKVYIEFGEGKDHYFRSYESAEQAREEFRDWGDKITRVSDSRAVSKPATEPKPAPLDKAKQSVPEKAVLRRMDEALKVKVSKAKERIAARKPLKGLVTGEEGTFDPKELAQGLEDHALVGFGHLWDILMSGVDIKDSLEEWSGRMVKEFGEAVRPHLDKLYAMAKDLALKYKDRLEKEGAKESEVRSSESGVKSQVVGAAHEPPAQELPVQSTESAKAAVTIEPPKPPDVRTMLDKNPDTKPMYVWNVHGYMPIDHAAMRDWNYILHDTNGKPIWVKANMLVHPDFHKYLTGLLGADKSGIRTIPILGTALKGSTLAKETLLSLSPFHIAQISLRAMMNGVVPRVIRWGAEGLRNDKDLGRLVGNSMTVGTRYDIGRHEVEMNEGLMASAGRGGLVGKIPIVKDVQNWMTKFTFERLLPSLKVMVGKDLLKRYDKLFADPKFEAKFVREHPEFEGVNDKAARAAALETNDRLGGQNYRDLGRMAGLQDVLRLGVLAPDWLESELNSAKRMFDPSGGKLMRRDILKLTAGMWITARIVNMLVSGNAHQEAPFGIVHKDDEGREKVYSMRTLPTDWMHAANDLPGFLSNRFSPLVRTGAEGISGRERMGTGRKVTGFDRVFDLARNVAPIGLQQAGRRLTGEVPQPDVTGFDQVVKAGFGTVFPYKTEAQKKAADLATDHAESGPVDSAMLKRHQLKMEYEDQLRAGKIMPKDIGDMVQGGAMTAKEGKEIVDNLKETQKLDPEMARFYVRASRLPMNEFLSVWDMSTAVEKTALTRLLLKKRKAYFTHANTSLTPAERIADPTYQKLRALDPNATPW